MAAKNSSLVRCITIVTTFFFIPFHLHPLSSSWPLLSPRCSYFLLFAFLSQYEIGVHRVQRVPATDTYGRVHTSTITVAVLPQPTEVLLDVEHEFSINGVHVRNFTSPLHIGRGCHQPSRFESCDVQIHRVCPCLF